MVQREIERLVAENRRLKAEIMSHNGGQPIRLTPQEQARLDALRRDIDPEVLKRIDVWADPE